MTASVTTSITGLAVVAITFKVPSGTLFTQSYTPTLSPTAALARQAGKSLSATLTRSAALLKAITRSSLTATLNRTGLLTKRITDAGFNATLAFVGGLTQAVVHFFTKSFTATLFPPPGLGLNYGDGITVAWPDSSGSGNNATPVGVPVFYGDSVWLGNTTTYFTFPTVTAPKWTVIAVMVRSNGNQNCVMGGDDGSHTNPTPEGIDISGANNAYLAGDGLRFHFDVSPYAGLHIFSATSDQGAVYYRAFWADGTALGATYDGGFPAQYNFNLIGARGDLANAGSNSFYLRELIFYDHDITFTEVANLEAYLSARHGITVASSGTPVLPTSISGLMGWWKADSFGGAATATLSRRTGKLLNATFSPVAAISRAVAKTFVAIKTLTAALTRRITDSGFVATLSFIGNLARSKFATRFFTATLSFSGAIKRTIGKALSATLSFIGDLATNLVHGGTVFTQNLFATLSFVGAFSVSKSFLKALTATLSFVGAFTPKQILTRAFTATLSFSAAQTRRIGKALSATQSKTAALTKRISDAGFAATLAFTGFLATSKAILKAFTATLSFSGSMAASKSFLKSLTATLSFVGTFNAKQILTRAFTATLNATATLSRSTGKAFAATLAFAASLLKRISRVFSALASLSGALVKIIRDAGFAATLNFTGTLFGAAAHFFTRAFTATLSLSATLTRFRLVQRVFAATLAFSGAVRRRTGKVFSASLPFSAALGKAIRKVLRGTLAFAVFFFKGGAITVLAGWITKCLAAIGISGSEASVTRAGSQLTVEKVDESGVKIQVTGSTLTVERTK
jgi:hypothetical protein